jgi:hypothetical protein
MKLRRRGQEWPLHRISGRDVSANGSTAALDAKGGTGRHPDLMLRAVTFLTSSPPYRPRASPSTSRRRTLAVDMDPWTSSALLPGRGGPQSFAGPRTRRTPQLALAVASTPVPDEVLGHSLRRRS